MQMPHKTIAIRPRGYLLAGQSKQVGLHAQAIQQTASNDNAWRVVA